MRIGYGSDAHALAAGRRLVLGGVEVDFELGLEGHSDADVLTHAIIDALLGAAALGTIGEHFSDEDPRWLGASSLDLLALTTQQLAREGWRVENVDATITAQRPKLAPHLGSMAARLAGHLRVEPSRVSVKASSPEGLGALGRGEGMAAQAVVLLERQP
ncbi:MAG: 2-C-methyl-D-erythritol 2,4-cyclodiphosphate synthase [Candidatus Dormibacteraeota bacterium]|uniref:2-C-methyl-D-erythritol 2,4-cyclodiphosphate synthase n=1 Tax=Candidatus Dormiibacter inghamiae TaxID=3127013 RepID=A0A934KFM6_9BACT|nr:2-C-methyl-D-erythritol 2,4-cyclodiphosphate synthase [Candidatus Dormibacteraeota bacterium]MBJ7605139.1 2-C-methyl-D-erythritol 2,4-cyclodiphosphate synthase [Candidatus Dormibacteraeota bacterium]